MNDFTKEELKEILLIFNECMAMTTQPPSTHELKKKIQSMIDNYCKHKFSFTASQKGSQVLCIKCGRCWNDN